jgi:hypothetical protein
MHNFLHFHRHLSLITQPLTAITSDGFIEILKLDIWVVTSYGKCPRRDELNHPSIEDRRPEKQLIIILCLLFVEVHSIYEP